MTDCLAPKSIIRQVEEAQLKLMLLAIINYTLMFVGEELTDEHKRFWVARIMEDKKVQYESLEDVAYVFHKICREKQYGKLSLNTFFVAFDDHLENKAIAREQNHAATKGSDLNPRSNAKSQLKELLRK